MKTLSKPKPKNTGTPKKKKGKNAKVQKITSGNKKLDIAIKALFKANP